MIISNQNYQISSILAQMQVAYYVGKGVPCLFLSILRLWFEAIAFSFHPNPKQSEEKLE